MILVVLLWATSFVASLLGVEMTLNPPQSDKTKKRYRVAFFCIGFLGIGLAIPQYLDQEKKDNDTSQTLGTIKTNTAAALDQLKYPIPALPQITVQTIPGLPDGVTNINLRYHMLEIRNFNDVEIDDFISRFQFPEPITTTVETDIPPGTVISWEPMLTKYSISGSGNKSFLGAASTRHYLFPSAYFFPGNRGQLTGFSDGGDTTGVWQLTIDKLPPHGVVSISFLTDNEGNFTNYIALANTEFKTNRAAISTTMRGDGKGGSILMNLTMAIIINTNYAVNPNEDWHFGTNWLRFYFEGLYEYPSAGKPGSQHFLVPFVFDTNSRAISSLPIQTDDGKWRRVTIEYQ